MNIEKLKETRAASAQQRWVLGTYDNAGEITSGGSLTVCQVPQNEDLRALEGLHAANAEFIVVAHALAPKLIDAVDLLQRISMEANSRGELNPGGCDENTCMGELYRTAQALLSELNQGNAPAPKRVGP